MPRASKKTESKQPAEQALEEGVRVSDIADLSTEEGGKIAALEDSATKLQAKTVEIDRAIASATNMMVALLGAAETDMGTIQSNVLSLATGEMTTEQLATKYGTLTNAESAQKLATLDQVSNAIGVKIREVQVQTEGLELERTKLLRTKKTFQVIGTVAEVINAADEAAYKHHDAAIAHETRQDDLDYSEGKRVLTKDRNETNLGYRGEANAIAKENEQNILSHNRSVNQILEEARAVSRSILQSKVDKRKFSAQALSKANNGGQSA